MAGIIYPRIEERRADLGVPKQRMADYLGLSYQALVNKLDGTSEFSTSEVKKLANWWNNSIDDLVYEEVKVEQKAT